MTDTTGNNPTTPTSTARRFTRARWRMLACVAACLAMAAGISSAGSPVQAASTVAEPPACTEPTPGTPPPAETALTVEVIRQAYFCILKNYYSGPTMDDRSLLVAGFSAFTQELNRDGRDAADADLPALTGDRHRDWAAFAKVYTRVLDRLPNDTSLRQNLMAVTLTAMVTSLQDDHAQWTHGGGAARDLGFEANVFGPQITASPGSVVAPLFVSRIFGGPAQAAGLRPGDIIESINGAPPFIDGQLTQAAAAQLYSVTPGGAAVHLQLYRPATGTRWTVALTPTAYRPDPTALQLVTSRLLPDNAAYVRLSGFQGDGATQVLAAISALRTGRTLTGVVLDLRGNHGGDPVLVDQLLGAFAHGKVTAYQCTVRGDCDTDRTDDSVTLLHLPLVVLTDRGCASACEHFSAAVKDLHLGTLVGTRTAGAIAGLAIPHLLSNGTALSLPDRHHLGPDREVIDRVGVAPDHYVPLTAEDLSTGKDPAVTTAMDLLHR